MIIAERALAFMQSQGIIGTDLDDDLLVNVLQRAIRIALDRGWV